MGKMVRLQTQLTIRLNTHTHTHNTHTSTHTHIQFIYIYIYMTLYPENRESLFSKNWWNKNGPHYLQGYKIRNELKIRGNS